MTKKQLFSGTMPFMMAKLGLGAITVVLSTVLFAILMGVGWLFGGGGMFITFCIWIVGTRLIWFAIMQYVGYLVKAGHIAVLAEAATKGNLPADQVNYGKAKVKERFATSNIYFGLDKLVSAAVRQIQNTVDNVAGAFDFIPGMDSVSGIVKFFISISLGYIDECCLGWTFYQDGQGAFKSAADGVVIYAQNWKHLLKSAGMTMLKTILIMILLIVAAFIPVGIIFKMLQWPAVFAFLIACLIAWVLKFAFIDSYIMVQMMAAYFEVAPTTVITFDLYTKLCHVSRKFKELFDKGQQEAEPEGNVV